NNQLRTSSNARNNQGRPFQRNNARGNVVAGNAGGQNRGGNVNPSQWTQAHSTRMSSAKATSGFRLLQGQDATYASPGEWCREQLLFLAGEQVTNFDDDVDDPTEKDLALNVDHIFKADQCDTFDSDVDEAPNIQTMFVRI
ncbi:hypothetical protein Tco_0384062, partial [Tanacetum coccineum]